MTLNSIRKQCQNPYSVCGVVLVYNITCLRLCLFSKFCGSISILLAHCGPHIPNSTCLEYMIMSECECVKFSHGRLRFTSHGTHFSTEYRCGCRWTEVVGSCTHSYARHWMEAGWSSWCPCWFSPCIVPPDINLLFETITKIPKCITGEWTFVLVLIHWRLRQQVSM